MRLDYFSDTDTLYIDLVDEPSVESEEVADGLVLDYGASGNVVGVEIEHASRRVQMEKLVVSVPGAVEQSG